MTRPPAAIIGIRPAVNAKCPRWLVPNCISNPSAVLPSGVIMTPALLIRRSIRRPTSTMSDAVPLMLDRHARSMSLPSNSASGTSLRRVSRAASIFSELRPVIVTDAPTDAKALAVSMPNPPVAPVMIACLPSSRIPSSTSLVVDTLLNVMSVSPL